MYYQKNHSWAVIAASRAEAGFASALQLSIDSTGAAPGQISNIVATAVSAEALAVNLGALLAGERVTVRLPLVGEREADIVWVAGSRAGVRLVTPVDEDELRDTICESDAITTYFPGLRGYGSSAHWGRA